MFAVLFSTGNSVSKGYAVAQWLRHCATSRKVRGFDSRWCHWKVSVFVADRSATDQRLKDLVFVSITASRCDEYFVHFVQSTKKIV